jgi:hypothetical protein
VFNDLGNARSLPARSCLVRLCTQCHTGCWPADAPDGVAPGLRRAAGVPCTELKTLTSGCRARFHHPRPPLLAQGPSRLRQREVDDLPRSRSDRSRVSGRAGAAHLPVPPGSGHVTPAQAAGPSARVGLRRLAVRGPGGLCSCEPCCVRLDQRSAACAAGPTDQPRGPTCPEIAPVLRITCVVPHCTWRRQSENTQGLGRCGASDRSERAEKYV